MDRKNVTTNATANGEGQQETGGALRATQGGSFLTLFVYLLATHTTVYCGVSDEVKRQLMGAGSTMWVLVGDPRL